MTCPIDEDLLALSLSGDLDAEQIASVSTHVKECGFCRNVLAELQFSKHLLTNTFEKPAEEDLRSVRIAVHSMLTAHLRWRFWHCVAAVAAAVTIFLAPALLRRNTDEQVHKVVTGQRGHILVASRPAQTIPDVGVFKQAHRRVHRQVTQAGLKSVVLSTNVSGKPELRMLTADTDVLILLQMDDNTHAN